MIPEYPTGGVQLPNGTWIGAVGLLLHHVGKVIYAARVIVARCREILMLKGNYNLNREKKKLERESLRFEIYRKREKKGGNEYNYAVYIMYTP